MLLSIKIETIGTAVRGFLPEENRHVKFNNLMEAIDYSNKKQLTISNAKELPEFFQQYIKHTPNESYNRTTTNG